LEIEIVVLRHQVKVLSRIPSEPEAVEHGRDLEAQLAMGLFLERSTTQSAGSLSGQAPMDRPNLGPWDLDCRHCCVSRSQAEVNRSSRAGVR
jgi:hypothetical protein